MRVPDCGGRPLTMDEAEAVLLADLGDGGGGGSDGDAGELRAAATSAAATAAASGVAAGDRTDSRVALEEALEESSLQLEEAHDALLRTQQTADFLVTEAEEAAREREEVLGLQLEAAQLAAQ